MIYVIEIVEIRTGEIVESFSPVDSESKAKKLELAALRRIDTENFYVDVLNY